MATGDGSSWRRPYKVNRVVFDLVVHSTGTSESRNNSSNILAKQFEMTLTLGCMDRHGVQRVAIPEIESSKRLLPQSTNNF